MIVSSTDISEEAELRLTSRLNQTIKNYWVALGKKTDYCVALGNKHQNYWVTLGKKHQN